MVVKNSFTLRVYLMPSFRELNGEIASKICVSLDRSSIRSFIIEEAMKQKLQFKTLLQGRHISLKMDSCTRMRTNYFAIDTQFKEKKTVTYELLVRNSQGQHSSDFPDVLKDYGLPKKTSTCSCLRQSKQHDKCYRKAKFI